MRATLISSLQYIHLSPQRQHGGTFNVNDSAQTAGGTPAIHAGYGACMMNRQCGNSRQEGITQQESVVERNRSMSRRQSLSRCYTRTITAEHTGNTVTAITAPRRGMHCLQDVTLQHNASKGAGSAPFQSGRTGINQPGCPTHTAHVSTDDADNP